MQQLGRIGPHNRPNRIERFWGQFRGIGYGTRLLSWVFIPARYKDFRELDFRQNCAWMGAGSLPMVCMCAMFVSLALTTQVVLESQKFQAQDLSGAMIAIGLMRELAALTISLAWCARVAAHLSAEAHGYCRASGSGLSPEFFLPKYFAALMCGSALAAFGLVVGFVCAALYAPTLGVTSTSDFLETARLAIKDKDILAYALKLALVNPTIGVLAGCICGSNLFGKMPMVVSDSVAATFTVGTLANLLISMVLYLP